MSSAVVRYSSGVHEFMIRFMKKDVKKIMWNCKASAPPSANFFLCNFVFFLPQDDGNVLV